MALLPVRQDSIVRFIRNPRCRRLCSTALDVVQVPDVNLVVHILCHRERGPFNSVDFLELLGKRIAGTMKRHWQESNLRHHKAGWCAGVKAEGHRTTRSP